MRIATTVRRISLLLLLAGPVFAVAQGCVAAHSGQRPLNELVLEPGDGGHGFSLHNLTVNVGYRVFNSSKHFVGVNEQLRYPAVENHENIFDFGFEYRVSPRWSLIADVPVFNGSRDQVYSPSGIYRVSGIGDITLGAQAWILRPPAENKGNLAVSLSLKVPTGLDNATGTGTSKGSQIVATADQSLQPGDGGWGFVVGAQGYQALGRRGTSAYGQGQYTFNPQDTNGVPTFRSQAGQGVMSVPDQYLYRLGFAQVIPKVHRLSASFGVRGEGVPAHDVFGDSNGFRRPGFILSIDPGIIYSVHRTVFSVNGPWAMYRNRMPSVPEIQNKIWTGDAFFADYTVVASVSHHF